MILFPPGLVLEVDKEIKIEGLYVLTLKVKEKEGKCCSNVEVADNNTIFGGGLVFKDSELEMKNKTYFCTKIDEKKLEFKLKN